MSPHRKKPSEDLFIAHDFTCGQSYGARIQVVIIYVSITRSEVQGITLPKGTAGLLGWAPASGLGSHKQGEAPLLR